MTVESSPTIFKSQEQLARLSASERIRYRLVGAGCRLKSGGVDGAGVRGPQRHAAALAEAQLRPGRGAGAAQDGRQ